MRKFFYFLLAAVTVVLAACGDGSEEPSVKAPEGAVPGIFSVSVTKKVYFSQGNLQYHCDAQVFRFAENQWDFVGDDKEGTVYVGSKKSDNQNVYFQGEYNGWIDLFGWATGKTPMEYRAQATYPTTFEDWGDNRITNGGNEEKQWRTLKGTEWNYLLTGRLNSADLFGYGTVNDVKGLILLPDDWKMPNGVPAFKTSVEQGLVWKSVGSYYYVPSTATYLPNTYTKEQWSVMEKAGAVFLPAAGIRSDADVGLGIKNIEIDDAGKVGAYWSAIPDVEKRAFIMNFYAESELYPAGITSVYTGLSVRLVKDIE